MHNYVLELLSICGPRSVGLSSIRELALASLARRQSSPTGRKSYLIVHPPTALNQNNLILSFIQSTESLSLLFFCLACHSTDGTGDTRRGEGELKGNRNGGTQKISAAPVYIIVHCNKVVYVISDKRCLSYRYHNKPDRYLYLGKMNPCLLPVDKQTCVTLRKILSTVK